jgi:uncharacterized protein (TIGR02444 family)
MADHALDGPHWRFALAVYGQPGVSQACLTLQDRCGVDVNVLLVGLYAWSVGDEGFAGERLGAIEASITGTRDAVVKPLRAIRRAMKDMPEAGHGPAWESVRNKVKSAELAAEQFEQGLLAAAVQPAGAPAGDADAAARRIVVHFARAIGADADAVSAEIATVAAAAETAAQRS